MKLRRLAAAAAFLALSCNTAAIADGSGDRGLGLGVTITPTGADYSDSLQSTAATLGNHAGYRTNQLSVLRLAAGAGTRTIVVDEINNLVGATTTSDLALGVYVDGSFYNVLKPTNIGWQPLAIGLDGAAHIVEIWTPYQQFDFSNVGNILFVGVSAVHGYGGTLAISHPTTTRQLVIYGDSIDGTGGANPGVQLGWVPLFRQIYPGRIAQEAWGGRATWDDTAPTTGKWGFGSASLLAARLYALATAQGATWHDYIFDTGTNDETAPRSTAATFQTSLFTQIDDLCALDPGGHFYVKTMLFTTLESTPNGNGEFPSTFRTAQTNAASGHACSVTVINGLNLTLNNAGTCYVDFAHPNNAGHQAIALGTGACAGTTSMKAVFGL